MLAPLQMNVDTVREPKTASQSTEYGSNLSRSSAVKVASGSQTQIRSACTSRRPRWIAAPYPCLVSNTSRAEVAATSADVPCSALLLTTTISSTMPNASNPLTTAAMLLRSRYVGKTTATVRPFHIGRIVLAAQQRAVMVAAITGTGTGCGVRTNT